MSTPPILPSVLFLCALLFAALPIVGQLADEGFTHRQSLPDFYLILTPDHAPDSIGANTRVPDYLYQKKIRVTFFMRTCTCANRPPLIPHPYSMRSSVPRRVAVPVL